MHKISQRNYRILNRDVFVRKSVCIVRNAINRDYKEQKTSFYKVRSIQIQVKLFLELLNVFYPKSK